MQKALIYLATDPTNGTALFQGAVGGTYVAAAAHNVKGGYDVGYSVCSLKEGIVSPTKGIALAIDRLVTDVQHPQRFYLGVSSKGGISQDWMAALIRVHIEMDVVSGRVKFPAWYVKILKRSGIAEMSALTVDTYTRLIESDKTPQGSGLRKVYCKARKENPTNGKDNKDTLHL